ncbi:hypothetical protein DRO30_02625 [Candidatus Bathyarchaeota archaeon]|nr:MAG: hypothetical protein DRO30_02625 [Candidatus Bathyarchaeota archaeon]
MSYLRGVFKNILGVFSKMHFHFSFSRTPLKEKISQAIFRLETQLNKLEQSASKLHQRDREMFERCIGAKASGDEARAAMYANECVEIRKIAKIILASQLAIEKVILRLRTVEDVGDLLNQMSPVAGIIKETRNKLKGIVPEVAYELEEINNMLGNTLIETGKAPMEEAVSEVTSDEAKKILDEAAAIAEQKMGEIYPKLPIPPQHEPKVEEPIEVAPQVSSQPKPQQPQFTHEEPAQPVMEKVVEEPKSKPLKELSLEDLEKLEGEVLNYIYEHGGELSLKKCAEALNVTVEDVRKILVKLEKDGKIVIT